MRRSSKGGGRKGRRGPAKPVCRRRRTVCAWPSRPRRWAFGTSTQYPATRRWSVEQKAILGLAAEIEPTYEVLDRLIHPDDRQWVEDHFRQAFDPASGGKYAADFRIRRANDGAERWVAANRARVFRRGGSTDPRHRHPHRYLGPQARRRSAARKRGALSGAGRHLTRRRLRPSSGDHSARQHAGRCPAGRSRCTGLDRPGDLHAGR